MANSRFLTRRRFLTLSGLAVSGVGLYTWQIEPHWIEVVEREMPIAGLPQSLVGAKVVQISDIHVGPKVDSQYLIEAMQRVSALAPDLTVITGDFMTCRDNEQVDETIRVMPGRSPREEYSPERANSSTVTRNAN